MGHSGSLFLYFGLFNKQLSVIKCSIKDANDWIRTQVLWYRKRPLCQLRHNHCPKMRTFATSQVATFTKSFKLTRERKA